MGQFLLDFLGARHRLGDLGANGLTVALAQLVDGRLHGRQAQIKLRSDVRVRSRLVATQQVNLERLEATTVSLRLVVCSQAGIGPGDERLGPAAVVSLLRREFFDRLQRPLFLLAPFVQRKELASPAALLGGAAAPFIDEKARQAPQQERPETAPLRVGWPQPLALDEPSEKVLG